MHVGYILIHFNGDLFGGIYATRLANYIGVSIRGNAIELPPTFLDYNAMARYQFIERNEQPLHYRLMFDRRRIFHVALPAPTFFDFQTKGRFIKRMRMSIIGGRRQLPSKRQLMRQQLLHHNTTPTTTLDIRQASHGPRPT